MSRILRDFVCECGYVKDDFAEIDDVLSCPQCGKMMRHAWLSAPNSNQLGPEGSDRSVKAMRHSFKQRFIKKEIDDVRHKHGEAFDDSLLSTAAQRIRDGKAPE